MKKVEMFVVTHKPLYIKIPKCYTPIKVGNNSDEKLNKYLKDNIGDNISSKNSSYCELTAIYWLYKNYELADYVGICHYRRFFVKGLFSRLLNENDILKLMSKYDVILPYKNKAKPNVWKYFVNSKSCGSENDLYKLKDIIKEHYPDYLDDFNKVMFGKSLSYCNMCIMTKENFIQYCEWLFSVMEKYEETIDYSSYNREQKRIFGYMSEFLLNVWSEKNNLSIGLNSIILFDENKLKVFMKKIKAPYKKIKGALNNGEI